MRSKFTKQQKFDMVMECRTSGYPITCGAKNTISKVVHFYSQVNQLKHDGAEVPYRTYAKDYHLDSKPDIVKLEIVDELSAEKTPMTQQLPSNNCAIEITIGQASIKVFNDVNPKLLSQVMSCLGGRL